jgi:3-oxoadipate enol-lactonase
MPTVERNGAEIYYEEQGQGEPLLLIMGLAGHLMQWIFQVPVLAQRFRVITFDNRGAGRTKTPPGEFTIRQMADDAAALLDHLGIERAHVVGWSMGGMIAQELTLNYPQKVNRLVLLASLGRLKPWAVPFQTFSQQARERDLDRIGLALAVMPWLYTAAFMTDEQKVAGALSLVPMDPYPISAAGFAGQAAAIRGQDSLDRLGQITAPTLVLVGAEDILTPPYYSRELAERIPGARLQILERGGHGMSIEYPLETNQALLAFLTETATPPQGAAATA